MMLLEIAQLDLWSAPQILSLVQLHFALNVVFTNVVG